MQTLDSTRPEGVKFTTAIMVAFLIVEAVLAYFIAHRVATITGSAQSMHIPAAFTGFFSLVGIIIAAVFVYLYWIGNNVGRWAVLIDSGLVILSALFSVLSVTLLSSFSRQSGLGTLMYVGPVINIFKACLAIYFFWYLNQPAIKAWFLRSTFVAGSYPPPAPPQGYPYPYASQAPSPYAHPETPNPMEPPPPPSGLSS